MSTPVEFQRVKAERDAVRVELEALRAAVGALADEWEADDREHLNTFGQHLPGSVLRMAELVRERLLDPA